MIEKTVHQPLLETAAHKKIQLKKLHAFRDTVEALITKADSDVTEVSDVI